MKSLTLLSAAICFLSACQGTQNNDKQVDSVKARKHTDSNNNVTAKKIITAYLDTTLTHRKTYVPMVFTKLDSNFDSPNTKIQTDHHAPKIWYGYKMTHTYRVVGVLNTLDTVHETFFIDSAITKVIGVHDTLKTVINR